METTPNEPLKELVKGFSFSFEHEGHTFDVKIDPESVMLSGDRIVLAFSVESENKAFARTTGFLEKEDLGWKFTEKMNNNFTHPDAEGYDPSLPRVKGLVGTFISELVLREIVATWVSDARRSEAINAMYEQLKDKQGLSVRLLRGVNSENPTKEAYMVFKDLEE